MIFFFWEREYVTCREAQPEKPEKKLTKKHINLPEKQKKEASTFRLNRKDFV